MIYQINMVLRPIDDLNDEVVRNHVKDLQEGKQSNVIILDTAPTADAPLLADMEWGVYENNLYQRVGSTIYKYTPDDSITVT